MIDNEAPNISSFSFAGDCRVKLTLGATLQMKNLHMSFSGAVHYTRVELPSSMPNLETATIHSGIEVYSKILTGLPICLYCSSHTLPPWSITDIFMQIANTPMLHSKYIHLKNLSIALTAATFSPTYDYFSLASFFDACPSLEIFLLDVSCDY